MRNLEIIGAERVTRTKFHVEDPQILSATVQNVVASATWHQHFLTADF